MKCAVCGNEAEQKHHISYEPEIEIPICVSCHLKVHVKHGVGLPAGHKPNGSHSEEIINELRTALTVADSLSHKINRLPHYTREEKRDGRYPIVEAESGLILDQLACGCGDNAYHLFGNPKTGIVYLRCCSCGCDWTLPEFKPYRPSIITQEGD